MCFCGKKEDAQKPVPLFLYGKELPWVATATHLGHELHDGGSMSYDIKCKGNGFISKSSEVRESFSFAHPTVIIRTIGLYCSDYYGAMLMNFQSREAEPLFFSLEDCCKASMECPKGNSQLHARSPTRCRCHKC